MPLQSDYVMRLIEQLCAVITKAKDKLSGEELDQPIDDVAGAAIGLALSMDPAVASRLSPASLKSLLELSDVNREVIALVAEATDLEAEARERRGDAAGGAFRHEQAAAARSLLPPGGQGAEG